MINLITINYPLEGKSIVNTEIDGDETLLDADVVIARVSEFPKLWVDKLQTWDDGIPRVYSPDSDRITNLFESRRNEVESLLENGKIIITFLEPLTGFKAEVRNTTRFETFTCYDFLPLRQEYLMRKLRAGKSSGENAIKLANSKNLFSQYFSAFKDEISYKAYFDIDVDSEDYYFLLNRSNKPVAATLQVSNGLVVFLPPIPYKKKNDKLLGIITSASKKFLTKHISTPPPGWVEDYKLQGEENFDSDIEELQNQIAELQKKKIEIEDKKKQLIKFKGLLYEQGTALEELVIASFRLMGFQAENREIDDMEHDAVFHSEEGRGIAEVEGKDNDAIHISKLDQLNRAVDEDFELNEDYPQGILIGNHFRLTNPINRKEPFTEKVKIVAEKKSFGLLTTYEIYQAVSKIIKNPENEDFKFECRKRILNTQGSLIKLV